MGRDVQAGAAGDAGEGELVLVPLEVGVFARRVYFPAESVSGAETPGLIGDLDGKGSLVLAVDVDPHLVGARLLNRDQSEIEGDGDLYYAAHEW